MPYMMVESNFNVINLRPQWSYTTLVAQGKDTESSEQKKISGENIFQNIPNEGLPSLDDDFVMSPPSKKTIPLKSPLDEKPKSASWGEKVTQYKEAISERIRGTFTMNHIHVHEMGDGFKQKAEDLKEVLKDGITQVSELKGFVNDHIPDNASILDFIGIISITIYNASQVAEIKHKVSIVLQTLMASRIISVGKLCERLAKCIVRLVTRAIEPELKINFVGQADEEAEAQEFVPELIQVLIDVVYSLFSDKKEMVAQGLSIKGFELKSLISGFKNVHSVGKAIEYIGDCCWRAISWVYFKIYGIPLFLDSTKVLVDECTAWMITMTEVLAKNTPGHMTFNAEYCKLIELHVLKGTELELKLFKTGYDKHNFMSFYKAVEEGKKLRDVCKSILRSAKPRDPPIVIQLSGPPNVGKSTLASMLSNGLARWFYSESGMTMTPPAAMWARFIENDYWDGYQNNFAVLYDDYMQHDDLEVRTKTALEIIHMDNTAPYQLHMSKTTDKDCFFFDSHLIILTSNSVVTPKLDLQDRNAFLRRRDFLIHVDQKGVDPKSKSPRQINGPMDPEKLEFRLVDQFSEELADDAEVFDYYRLVEIIAKKIRLKYINREGIEGFLQNHDLVKDYKTKTGKEMPSLKTVKGKKSFDDVFPQLPLKTRNLSKLLQTGDFGSTVEKKEEKEEEVDFNAQGEWSMCLETSIISGDLAPEFSSGESVVTKVVYGKNGAVYFCRHFYQDEGKIFVSPIFGVTPGPWFEVGERNIQFSYMEQGQKKIVKDHVGYYNSNYMCELGLLSDTQVAIAIFAMRRDEYASMLYVLRNSIVAETKNLIDTTKEKLIANPWIGGLIILLSVLFGSLGILKIVSMYKDLEAQGIGQYDKRAADALIKKKQRPFSDPRPRGFKKMDLYSQGESTEAVLNSVFPNTGKFAIIDIKGLPHSCNYVFIFGHVFATAQHMLLHSHGPDTQIVLLRSTDNTEITFKLGDCIVLNDEGNDVVLIQVPKNVCSAHRDIRHHFVVDEDLISADVSEVVMMRPGSGVPTFIHATNGRIVGSIEYKLTPGSSVVVDNANTLTYSCSTVAGDCAALVAVNNNKINHKIIGLHIAGGTSRKVGACCIVTQALFKVDEIFAQGFTPRNFLDFDPEVEKTKRFDDKLKVNLDGSLAPDFVFNPDVHYRGKVDPKLFHRLSGKTRNFPSPMFEVFSPHTTEPAVLTSVLRDGVRIHPATIALKKVGQPPIDGSHVDYALMSAINRTIVEDMTAAVEPRLLTLDESINGVDGWKFSTSLHMSTSMGFDRQARARHGKKDFFIQDPITLRYTAIPEVVHSVGQLNYDYALGMTGLTMAELNLKDELRPLDRVEAVKTRFIVSQEGKHLLSGRMSMGAFIETAMIHHLKLRISLGLNPLSLEWAEMIKTEETLGFEDLWDMDGDAENYDWSTQEHATRNFVELVHLWYATWCQVWGITFTKEHANQIAGAISDCTLTTNILLNRDVISPKIAYFSGSFITSLMNCINGQVEHKYCFLQAAKNIALKLKTNYHEAIRYFFDLEDVEDIRMEHACEFEWVRERTDEFQITPTNINSYFVVNTGGDDFRASGNRASRFYTFQKLKHLMKENFGRSYTSTDKTAVIGSGQKGYLQSTYLARGFRKDHGLIFAPMNISDIMEQLNWVTDRMPVEEAMFLKCESALREFFHHGRKVFDEWKLKLNTQLLSLGYKTVPLEYDELLRSFVGNEKIELETPFEEVVDVEDTTMYVAQGYTSIKDSFYGTFGFIPYHVFTSQSLGGFLCKADIFRVEYNGIGIKKKEALEDALTRFVNLNKLLDKDGFTIHPGNWINQVSRGIDGKVYKNRVPVHEIEIVDSPMQGLVHILGNKNAPDLPTDRAAPLKTVTDAMTPKIKPEILLTKLAGKGKKLFSDKPNPTYQYDMNAGELLEEDFSGQGYAIVSKENMRDIKYMMYTNRMIITTLKRKYKDLAKELEKDEFVAQGDSPADTTLNDSNSANLEVNQLTQIRDTAPVVEQHISKRVQPFYEGTDPYDTHNMGGVLERTYRLEDVTWSGSDTVNTSEMVLNFPYALINASANIQDKLSFFQYFRADVELEFKINTTPFHFGTLIGAWIPVNTQLGTSNMKLNNIFTMSSCNAFFISANKGKSVRITIPYINPQQYVSTTQAVINDGYFGTVCLRVLNQLALEGASNTPSVVISVFGRFKNVEIAGPTLNIVSIATKSRYRALERLLAVERRKNKEKEEEYTAQGKEETPKQSEQEKKSSSGIISGIAKSVGAFATMVGTTGIAGPYSAVATAVGFGASAIGGIAKAFGYNKPLSLEAVQPVQLSLVNGLTYGSGLMTTQDLSYNPKNSTSNSPANFGCDKDYHQLVNLFTKPGLFDTWSFTSSSAAGTVIKKYYVNPNTCATVNGSTYYSYHVPLSAIAYNFSLWRGTIKYLFQIVCSQYTVGRLRFAWHPTHSEIPSSFTEGEGDFISKIVDFRGDTNVSFSVPYLREVIYCPSVDTFTKGDSYSAGALSISIVNVVTSMSTTGSSNVYVNCYIAGHSDMDFVQPIERSQRGLHIRTIIDNQTMGYPVSFVAQGSDEDQSVHLEDIFAQEFPTLIEAHTQSVSFVGEGEKILDILTLNHRFIQNLDFQGTTLNATWNQFSLDLLVGSNFEGCYALFADWFMYQRGSFNWKVLKDVNAANSPAGMLQGTLSVYNPVSAAFDAPTVLANAYGRNGIVTEDTTYKPAMEFKQPWVNQYAFVESVNRRLIAGWGTNMYARFVTYDGSLASTLPISVWTSIGDDFSFGWPLGAPVISG